MIATGKKIIDYLVSKPKTLFLIDGLGALLTAFLLFVVLRNFSEYFGMSKTILTYLSAIALLFCIYSATCFFFLNDNWTLFIRIISYANLLYCTLTISLMIMYYPVLTTLGITYFLAEIAIIFGLVYIELNAATIIKRNNAL